LSLAKRFIRHLKLTIAEDRKLPETLFEGSEEEAESSSGEEDVEMADDTADAKDTLYRFVGHQSKACLRKGLSIVKQLYSKFSHLPTYIESLSGQIYSEVLKDQLPLLNTNVSIYFLLNKF